MTKEYETRMRAIGKIPPATKEVSKKIWDLLRREARNHLIARYKIGKCVNETFEDTVRYGIAPIDHIACELDLQPDVLRACLRIYEEFTLEKLDELVSRALDCGFALHFTHVAQLANEPNARKRAAFIDKMFKERLSTNQLAIEMCAQSGLKNRPGGGRPHKRPTSPGACYCQVTKKSKEVRTKFEGVWAETFKEVNEMEPDSIDQETLDRLYEAEKELDALAKSIREGREAVQTNRARMERVINCRKEHEDSVEEATVVSRKPAPLSDGHDDAHDDDEDNPVDFGDEDEEEHEGDGADDDTDPAA